MDTLARFTGAKVTLKDLSVVTYVEEFLMVGMDAVAVRLLLNVKEYVP